VAVALALRLGSSLMSAARGTVEYNEPLRAD